jgi:uncharacterized protein
MGDPVAPAPMPMGSDAEWLMQVSRGTRERAEKFYENQVLDHLNTKMCEFVARQEMVFIATADAIGNCDATFRAGPPGFISVLSVGRIAWPEYRGNGVMASLGNINENPHASLLFVDFFREVIGLHVNGYAELIDDGPLRSVYPDLPTDTVPGRQPECWVILDVEEAYVHCRKHIPRLAKAPRERRAWGTDDSRSKGGDFFGVAAARTGAAGGPSDLDPVGRTSCAISTAP